jgi:hypothetical protein
MDRLEREQADQVRVEILRDPAGKVEPLPAPGAVVEVDYDGLVAHGGSLKKTHPAIRVKSG